MDRARYFLVVDSRRNNLESKTQLLGQSNIIRGCDANFFDMNKKEKLVLKFGLD